MQDNTYHEIVLFIKNFKGLTIRCLPKLKERFPSIKHGTLCSIISSEYQKLMKQKYIKTEEMVNKYTDAYNRGLRNKESPGIILRIAEQENIAPCLIAKLILHKYLIDLNDNSRTVNEYLRDTSLLQNKELAYEIFLCTIYDDQYSPIVETMRSSLGQQYEILLYRQISTLGIAYRDEEYLRKYGYDKTPDVKLDIPISIDGCIIHWIESKALFGDRDVHKEYVKNQYSSYWNRFGFGLVIYWFGYLESIANPGDKRFLIRDRVPDKITKLMYN